MKFRYFRGSKFFQRHWVVNLVKEEAKKNGVFGYVVLSEEDEQLRERYKKKIRNAIHAQRLWEFIQPFLDDCMVRFGINYLYITREDKYFAYFSPRIEERGFFGKHISKSEIKKVEFAPHQHEIYSLIKNTFKQYYDSKSV